MSRTSLQYTARGCSTRQDCFIKYFFSFFFFSSPRQAERGMKYLHFRFVLFFNIANHRITLYRQCKSRNLNNLIIMHLRSSVHPANNTTGILKTERGCSISDFLTGCHNSFVLCYLPFNSRVISSKLIFIYSASDTGMQSFQG